MAEISESKMRYLEMIQEVIKRMASNSFMLKGWAVTLIAGIFALSAKEAKMSFFIIAYIPVFLFWFLDSYYLQLERKYRILFNTAVKIDSSNITFDLEAPESSCKEKTCYLQSLFSGSEIIFYLPSGLLVAIVIIISQNIGS